MELIIQHMDYETITHEQSLCFESIVQIFQRSIKKSKAATTIDMMILTLQQVLFVRQIEEILDGDTLVHPGDVRLVGHGFRETDSIDRRMLLLVATLEILSVDDDHQEHAGQSLFESIRCASGESDRLSSS